MECFKVVIQRASCHCAQYIHAGRCGARALACPRCCWHLACNKFIKCKFDVSTAGFADLLSTFIIADVSLLFTTCEIELENIIFYVWRICRGMNGMRLNGMWFIASYIVWMEKTRKEKLTSVLTRCYVSYTTTLVCRPLGPTRWRDGRKFGRVKSVSSITRAGI